MLKRENLIALVKRDSKMLFERYDCDECVAIPHEQNDKGRRAKTDLFNSTKHEKLLVITLLENYYSSVRGNLRFNLFFIYKFIVSLKNE
jgi:hypothetical protein